MKKFHNHITYERTEETVLTSPATVKTDSDISQFEDLRTATKDVATSLHNKRLSAFKNGEYVSEVTLSECDLQYPKQLFKQVRDASEQRWQQFFSDTISYSDLKAPCKTNLEDTLYLKNADFEVTEKTPLTVTLSPVSPPIQIELNANLLGELDNVEYLILQGIDTPTDMTATFTKQKQSNINTSTNREVTAETIKQYLEQSNEEQTVMEQLFTEYLTPQQQLDFTAFLLGERRVVEIPVLNPNIFPVISAICDTYGYSYTVLPTEGAIIVTKTETHKRQAEKFKKQTFNTEDQFHTSFGNLLNYPPESITYYSTLQQRGVNAKTYHKEDIWKRLHINDVNESDIQFLTYIPYIPAPTIESIETAIKNGRHTYRQLKASKIGKNVLSQLTETPHLQKI